MRTPLYPVFLRLERRRALIAGGGSVALRKARGLLACGARVVVVAPEIDGELARLPVRLVRRRFRPADLDGAAIAFAATDSRRVNARIARSARLRGVFVNVADDRSSGDFHVPAVARTGRFAVAVSTGGASPKLAGRLRDRLAVLLRSSVKARKR